VYVIAMLQIFFFSDFNGLCQLTAGKLNIALMVIQASYVVQHHSHDLHERLMHD
jgi:hypothetical protein